MKLDPIRKLGHSGLSFFQRLGRGNILFFNILRGSPALLLRPGLLIQQVYSVGVLSLLIIFV